MKKVMTDEQLAYFINNVGRLELFEELEDFRSGRYILVRHNTPHPYPSYLKTIRATLVTLGDDEQWVESDFRDALEAKYYKK